MSVSMSRGDKRLKEAYDKMTIAVQKVNDKVERHEKKTADKITSLLFGGVKFFENWKIGMIPGRVFYFVLNNLLKSDMKFVSKIQKQLKKIYKGNDIEVNKALFGEENFSETLHTDFSKHKNMFALQWPIGKLTDIKETYGVTDTSNFAPKEPQLDERGFRIIDKLKLDSFDIVQQRYKKIVSKRPFLFRYLPSNLRIKFTLFLVGIKQFMRALPKILPKIPGALWNKFMMKLRAWFNK